MPRRLLDHPAEVRCPEHLHRRDLLETEEGKDMIVAAEILLLTLLSVLAAGSLSNLSSHPHWLIRGWDFPRVQIVVLAWLITITFILIEQVAGESPIPVWIPTTLTIALTVWHGIRIAPYTMLAPKQARGTRAGQQHDHRSDDSTVRIVVSNVQQENDQHQTWRRVIEDADADIVVILEADDVWVRAAEPLFDRYPHRVLHPQNNCYGMVLLSRLPIRNHRTRFLVQDDIPSMDAEIEMPTDQIMRLVAVHPRPPEPIRDHGATARDAELTLWGEKLEDESKPTVICGDLNDVAWSQTTRLFLRVSGLLDPRRGRGFFNTFHADYWFLRFPLDHIFHSVHFTVSGIRRLPYIGSDHFPMQIDLRLEPDRRGQHDVLDEQADDDAEAATRIGRAQEKTNTNGEVDRTSTEQAIHG